MYRCMSSLFRVNGNPLSLCIQVMPRSREKRFVCHWSHSTTARSLNHIGHNLQPSSIHQAVLCRCISSTVCRRRRLPSAFPVVDGTFQLLHRHVFEVNLQNSQACEQRYLELKEKVLKAGGENAIARHTQRNKKVLVRNRLHMLLDDDDYLELGFFAGLGLPYGDVPSACILTGIGKINGLWCMFIANDATVKGGTAYPITIKKQLRAQEMAIQNRLPCVYLVDSGGAFLPLQSDIFPDKNHGGLCFYNEAIMSAMKIPQVAVVCGSCTAGGAYVPTMTEEAIIVHRIGTLFLAGPALVKAATGEEVTSEDLGGARLHSEVSGCVDHFAAVETEAFECARNIISTLNFKLPEEDSAEFEEPLYNAEELMGLAPKSYSFSMDIKLIVSRLTDGSRFQEFKSHYGTTLVTGFAKIEGHLVGIVASNGKLTYEACLKGSHFIQLCDKRDVPLIFLQNTAPEPMYTLSQGKADSNTMVLKAQGSMMSTVACASTPKITVVIGGCHGGDSYAMCGRAFDPNFLFLWPNARVSILAPGHAGSLVLDGEEAENINQQLKEQSSAFFSSGRLWDDGVILPQDTRKVLGKCLKIIKQQEYQLSRGKPNSIPLRM